MSAPKRRGGDSAPGAAPTRSRHLAKDVDGGESIGPRLFPTVSATRIPESARRSMPVDWVPVCCFCTEGNHLHRVNGHGPVRRSGCGRGRYYIVATVRSGRAQPEAAA
jgi:hypothetical protein